MSAFLANLFSLTVGNVFTLGITFIASLIMIQRLSQAEYGLHSAVLAVANTVMALADLGMLSIATRDLVRRAGQDQRDTYSSFLTFQMVLSSAVCLATILIVGSLGSFPGQSFLIFVIGLFVMVWSYAPIVPTEALLTAQGRIRRIALLQSFYALFTAFAVVAIVLTRTDSQDLSAFFRGWGHSYSAVLPTVGGRLGLIYLALAVLSAVTIGMYLVQARRLLSGGIRLVFRPAEWKVYFGQAIPSGLSGAFQQSCLRLGAFITYVLVSSESASYLGISILLLTGIVSIVWVPYSINILPVMTRLYAHAREPWRWMAGRSVTLLLAITLPIAVGGTLLAVDILHIVAPSQVIPPLTFQVFIWAMPPLVVATFLYQLFLIQGQLRRFMILSGEGAAVNLGLCLVLTRFYGAPGAALAAVISSGLIALLCVWHMRGEVRSGIRWLDGVRLAVAIAGLVMTVQATAGLTVFVRIGLSAVVYGIALVVTGMFTSQDRKTVRALLAVGQVS